jgi:dethiobiotin synthetase
MTKGVFITATDTGAGKTHFSSLLLRSLRAAGVDAVGFKPFCCGERDDADRLYEACDGAVELALINPIWLRVPAAPYTAALVENRALDVATALDAFNTLRSRHAFVVVEGAGGWRVPLTDQLCLSDFAAQLALPVVVVVANRLGALNHTQLTVDSIAARGSVCAGVVLNEPDYAEPDTARITNKGVLEQLLAVPVLGELAHGAAALPEAVLKRLRGQGILESVLPG